MSVRDLAKSQSASVEPADPGIVGDPLALPHEHAWREALRGFTDPNLFTAEMYRAHVQDKPELAGARAVLEVLGVPDAAGLALPYADRMQKWLEYLVQDDGAAALHDRITE